MTWFRVDDSFYDHPKVLGLDMAARGLWVSAGTYCARHLTDGVISDREIRVIGGTRRQAEKLVAAGLWRVLDPVDNSVDKPVDSAVDNSAGESAVNLSHGRRASGGASASARRYVFNDWRDFQPTRADVTARRNEDAERKRAARAAKRAKQQNEKNVRSDGAADVQEDGSDTVRAPSALPDPARPDPAHIGKEVASHLSVVPREDGLADDPLEVLAAATRRARAAGISESAIKAGFAEYDRRPEPKGPGLLRTLIDDAWAAERSRAATDDARAARRAAIDACELCDDNGKREVPGGLARCDHRPPEASDTPPWEAAQ